MQVLKLFHVSEESNIQVFEPRPVPSPDSGVTGNAVWAVDEEHLANYLLPRDCPRITFTAVARTSPEDRRQFLMETSPTRVIALESRWFSKIQASQLYLYEFPIDTFELADAGAGYFISRSAVVPKAVTQIKDLMSELLRHHIEIRFLPDLWELREAVIASSLEFSIIRFRNAQPRIQSPKF